MWTVHLSPKVENDSVQQYVEIGSNLYVGTKDGMQYALIQSSDNKLRLVEVRKDLSIDINTAKRSFGSMIKDATFNIESECTNTPSADDKTPKLMALKSESSPCKGQGDEIGNSVLSTSYTISSLKDSYTTLNQTLLRENVTFVENSPQITYTTLTPRQEKLDSAVDNSNCFLNPESSIFASPPIFSTPLVTKPSRYTKRSRMPLIPQTDLYSPIPRPSLSVARQRRPKYTKSYQYNPQVLNSSTPSSNISASLNFSTYNSGMSGNESKTSGSSGNFNTNQLSLEYPRVPNNTPSSPNSDLSGKEDVFSVQWMPHIADQMENYMGDDPRETHNEKERKRRRRIKIACQCMRTLTPCVTDKTDNATVFERSVLFIEFVRKTLGGDDDLEFIEHNYRKNDG